MKSFCLLHNVGNFSSLNTSISNRAKRSRKTLEDFVTDISDATCCQRAEVCDADAFRSKLFYPCLDRMVAELERCFSTVAVSVLEGVEACSPKSCNFLDVKALKAFATHYGIEFVPEEALVAKNFSQTSFTDLKEQQMPEVYRRLNHRMFPTLCQLMLFAMMIPVTSCSCERGFSVLRLQNWMRTTMTNEQLHSLEVLSIEKDTFDAASVDDIIHKFAVTTNRRHSLEY